MDSWKLINDEWVTTVEFTDKNGEKTIITHVRPRCGRCELQGFRHLRPPVRKMRRKLKQRWVCQNNHWFETAPIVIHKVERNDGWVCRPCPHKEYEELEAERIEEISESDESNAEEEESEEEQAQGSKRPRSEETSSSDDSSDDSDD